MVSQIENINVPLKNVIIFSKNDTAYYKMSISAFKKVRRRHEKTFTTEQL